MDWNGPLWWCGVTYGLHVSMTLLPALLLKVLLQLESRWMCIRIRLVLIRVWNHATANIVLELQCLNEVWPDLVHKSLLNLYHALLLKNPAQP